MSDLYLLFNHTITLDQKEQTVKEFGVEKIIMPPAGISMIWAAVPPEKETLRSTLEPVFSWLDSTAAPSDYILVQGEFGACFLLVQYGLEKGFIPVYSTTERRAVEQQLSDGRVQLTHTFCHVRFRQYGR